MEIKYTYRFPYLYTKFGRYTCSVPVSKIEIEHFISWLMSKEGQEFDDKITEIEKKYGTQSAEGWT